MADTMESEERAAARRRDAIAAADAGRDDPDARPAVLETYLTHRAHLEPATDEGTRRIWFVLEHVPRDAQVATDLEDLFRDAGAMCTEADTADRALVASAALALHRDDFDAAHQRLREALVRRRGSNTAIERAACINLVAALRREHRYPEALIVARRAATMQVSDDEARGRSFATSMLAETMLDLRETELAARITEELAGMAPLDPGDAGSRAALSAVAWLRARVAHRLGRHDEAVWRLQVLEARENPRQAARRAELATSRARILLDAGRFGEAAFQLRTARGRAMPTPQEDVPLSILEARAAEAQGDLGTARERAAHAITVAEGMADTPGPHRFKLGELVPLFGRLDDVARERRCLEIVATEQLDQIARVDRSARTIPELTGEICVEDRAVLRRVRDRALVESRDTLTAFAHLLAPALRDGDVRALVLAPTGDDLIRVCAWCARVAGRDDRWLPLGDLIPAAGPLRATHGMCPECLSEQASGPASPS